MGDFRSASRLGRSGSAVVAIPSVAALRVLRLAKGTGRSSRVLRRWVAGF